MTFSVSGHSLESLSSRTDKDSRGDGLADNLSSRQLLDVVVATVMQKPDINEDIAVAASESCTRTNNTEGEQNGHVRANCIGNCQVQLGGQL